MDVKPVINMSGHLVGWDNGFGRVCPTEGGAILTHNERVRAEAQTAAEDAARENAEAMTLTDAEQEAADAARKADENKKTVKGPVSVTGIWLRKEGKDRIVVLAEVDGKWRTLMTETWPLDGEGEFSHIIEPIGISKAPIDKITEQEI